MKTESLMNKGHCRFWCLLGILLLLIMVRYAFQVDIPRIVLLLVIGITVLFGDRDEIIATCICFIPMHESIDFFYALTLCTVVYVLKNHQKIHIGSSVLLVIIIIVWELLHCFLTDFSVVDFLTYIIPFIIIAVLMYSGTEKLNYPFIVRAFAWSTLGISVVLLMRVLHFSGYNISLGLAGLQRLGSDLHSNIHDVTISGGQINPNSLGIITVLASTGLMQLRSMKLARKEDTILMCVMIVLAALGTSRTYLACLALMILLLIFSEKGGLAKKFRLIAILSVAVTMSVILLAVLFPDTFLYFVSRFSVADITTGRDGLFSQYNSFITSNPMVLFFGIGLQDYGNRLVHFYRAAANSPHNSIQELVIAWGIPGVFLFGALFFIMYRISSQKNKNQSLINWIPLIIILFKSIAGQLLTSPYTMLALLFAYLSLCTDMSPKDDQCIFTRPQVSPGGSGKNIKKL